MDGKPSGGFAALEGGLKKGGTFRDQDGQAAGGGGAQRLAFLLQQGLVVSRFFDEFMPVIGAGVGSDFGGAVEQAHTGGRSHQGQRPAQGLGRDGIVVEVEADAEGFIGTDGSGQVTGERMSGKRQQARPLFLENLGNGAGVIAGPRTLMSDLVAPIESLTVEIGQGGKGTSGEEAVTNILNGALHAAFFIAPRRAAGASGEMVVGREFEKTGVEMDGIATAFQDHAAEIVGGNVARRSPQS